jgi:4-amino-4-deoxy-L-arabinose transferase-like glycosyltransferase
MRSGIIFQFSNTLVFVVLILGVVFLLRKRRTLTLQERWPVMTALCVSTLTVLIRNGYRIVELSGGWKGHLMRTERYLIGLDMVPMAVGIGSFVVFPPSFFLHEGKKLEINSMELSA